jgi:signal peptidase I
VPRAKSLDIALRRHPRTGEDARHDGADDRLRQAKSWPVVRGRELVEALIVAALLAAYARTFLVRPFRIPSSSMAPSLLAGDQLLVNRFVYGPARWAWERRLLPLRPPRRGDVAVFRYPREPRIPYVKRVLGVPGEIVLLRRRELLVDGRPLVERGYAHHSDAAAYPESVLVDPFYGRRDNFGPVVVPPASWFVLGDNRELSADSRFWGFVPRSHLLGRAVAVYWSWRPAAGGRAGGLRWRRVLRLVR